MDKHTGILKVKFALKLLLFFFFFGFCVLSGCSLEKLLLNH